LVFVTIAVALAGCAQAPAASTLASSSAAAPPPKAGASTGSLSGVVVDDEMVPVADADVGLVEDAKALTKSDATGRFVFNDLEPGTYSVAVQKIGYETGTQRVSVIVGEVRESKITIKRVVLSTARVATYIAAGFIELGWKVPAIAGSVTTPNVTSADLADVYYAMDKEAASAVSAMTWQPNVVGTAKRMFLAHYLSKKGCVDQCDFLGRVTGMSPLLRRTDNLLDVTLKPGLEINAYFGLSSCSQPSTGAPTTGADNCTAAPDTLVEVAIQQKMTVYTSVFYVDPAPVGYTPLPK
jgi:hypothetical protein